MHLPPRKLAGLRRPRPPLMGRLAARVRCGQDGVYALGFRRLGPAVHAFLAAAHRHCVAAGIEDVFFLANDGCGLGELFAELHPASPVRAHVLALSRDNTLLLSPAELASGAFRGALEPDAGATLYSLIRISCGVVPVAADPAAFGLDWSSPLAAVAATPAFGAWLAALAADPAHAVANAELRRRLADYLGAAAFFGRERPKAWIDTGWNEPIVRSLRRHFGARPDFPDLVRLYFGRTAGGDGQGLAPAARAAELLAAHALAVPLAVAVDLRRQACGAVRPVFGPESWHAAEARAVRAGVRDYLRSHARASAPATAGDEPCRPAPFGALLPAPTRAEARTMASLRLPIIAYGTQRVLSMSLDGSGYAPFAGLARRFARRVASRLPAPLKGVLRRGRRLVRAVR